MKEKLLLSESESVKQKLKVQMKNVTLRDA